MLIACMFLAGDGDGCVSRMDWTDVYYRQLARLISRHTWLWTEMMVDKTVINTATPEKFLWCVFGGEVGGVSN